MTAITKELANVRQRIRNLKDKHYTHTRAAQDAYQNACEVIRVERERADEIEMEIRAERSKEALLLELKEKEACQN